MPIRSSALCLALIVLVTGLISLPALAAEKITDFHDAITVNADGSLAVVEEITVNAEGDQIRHGIERDFPVRFTDWTGARRTTSFELAGVTLDGADVHYELIPIDNGVRVRIGSADATVARGVHKFVLTYKTANEITSDASHDILYWNVTGNGWELPIDKASAVVSYPQSLKPETIQLKSYTGLAGATVEASSKQSQREGLSYFETTQPLPTGWGFSIVALLPKGTVTASPDAGATASPGINGVGPSGSGPPGSPQPGPSGSGGRNTPWYTWLFIIPILLLSLLGRSCSGCGGCLGLPRFGGWGGGGPGMWGGGGGGFTGGSGGSSGGGSGGSFSGGSSGGGGGGGGGRGW